MCRNLGNVGGMIVTQQLKIIQIILEEILQPFRIEYFGHGFGSLIHGPLHILHSIPESFQFVDIELELGGCGPTFTRIPSPNKVHFAI